MGGDADERFGPHMVRAARDVVGVVDIPANGVHVPAIIARGPDDEPG